MVSTNHVKLGALELLPQPVSASRNAAASTAAVIRKNCFKGMTSFYGICEKRLLVYKKHSTSTSVAETAAKYNCRIVNLPYFLGQKGVFPLPIAAKWTIMVQ